MGLTPDEEQAETFDFEGNSTIVYEYNLNPNETNILLDLAMFYLQLLFSYEKCSFFGRSTVSLDVPNLTSEELQVLKNGIQYSQINSLYQNSYKNFSEKKDEGYYVLPNLTITTGNILTNYIPSLVIDDEISMINKTVLMHSKLHDENIENLLSSKKKLQLLKQQILYKYKRLEFVYLIMNYVSTELFHIDEQIESLDSLLEISYREKEFRKTKNSNFFGTVLAVISAILSSSPVYEYVVQPIYEIRFNREMTSIDTIINYLLTVILMFFVISLIYFFPKLYLLIKTNRNK